MSFNLRSTASRAICDSVINESLVPPNGPFVGYLSHYPWNVSKEEVRKLLEKFQVTNIQLSKDSQNDRVKGFIKIEFETKCSLLAALKAGNLMLKGRLVSMLLQHGSGNWRVAAPIPQYPDKGLTRPGKREKAGGFHPEPSTLFSDCNCFLEHDSGGFWERDGDRGSNRLSLKHNETDRDRDGDIQMRFCRKFERENRECRREPPPLDKVEPKSRPKLDVQLRTKSLELNVTEGVPSSIFGWAKPVDTLKREMEIEDKLTSQIMTRSHRSSFPQHSITPVPNRSRSSYVSWSCQDIHSINNATVLQQNVQFDDESKDHYRKSDPVQEMEPKSIKQITIDLEEMNQKFNELTERHNSLMERHNSLMERHNSLMERHNSLMERHNSLIERHNSLMERHNSLMERHNSLMERHNSLMERHNSLEQEFTKFKSFLFITEIIKDIVTTVKRTIKKGQVRSKLGLNKEEEKAFMTRFKAFENMCDNVIRIPRNDEIH